RCAILGSDLDINRHARDQVDAPQSRGRIAEIEINILQRDEDRKTEVVRELREVQSKLSELGERKVAALDQLKRVEIVAPQGGIVHEMTVHAKGAVIQPGNPILMVVPAEDKLVVTARVAPAQIDRVRFGSTAFLLFTALNQRTTPTIEGVVKRISADLSRDQVTGEHYYSARILIEDEELAKLGSVDLIPGMPVDVQIRTEDRTALSYLLKPFTDQAMRAFRER
ncbi:MAG: HlyD family efflux transporter periplasmic adaptor subunit, partial [Pseudomonadota bacterium]